MMKKKVLIIGIITFVVLVFLVLSIILLMKNMIASKGEQACLSLTFDDGLESHYTTVYPLMKKYGFVGVVYVIANWTEDFEGRKLMTWEQITELQDNGWEIGSHTLHHSLLTLLNEEEIETELKDSKLILEGKGFVIKSLAFPFGIFDSRVLNITKKYYFSSRPLFWGDNSLSEINKYELKGKWMKVETNSTEVCEWIQNAKENNSWLILIFHHIGEGKRPLDVSAEKFEQVLKCINDSNIKVRTVSEIILEQEEK